MRDPKEPWKDPAFEALSLVELKTLRHLLFHQDPPNPADGSRLKAIGDEIAYRETPR